MISSISIIITYMYAYIGRVLDRADEELGGDGDKDRRGGQKACYYLFSWARLPFFRLAACVYAGYQSAGSEGLLSLIALVLLLLLHIIIIISSSSSISVIISIIICAMFSIIINSIICVVIVVMCIMMFMFVISMHCCIM